jgi:small subunit ribosomal protein S6
MAQKFTYETMYILRPDLGDEAIDEAIGQFQAIVQEQGAEILETQHRGKRRLAYEIDNHREGIYIQMDYVGPGATIAVLERAMRLSESVLRYLTVKQDVVEEDDDDTVTVAATATESAAPPPGAV